MGGDLERSSDRASGERLLLSEDDENLLTEAKEAAAAAAEAALYAPVSKSAALML